MRFKVLNVFLYCEWIFYKFKLFYVLDFFILVNIDILVYILSENVKLYVDWKVFKKFLKYLFLLNV